MNTKFVAAAQAIAEHFKAAEARRGEPFGETFIDPMNNDAVTPNTAGIPVSLLRALAEANDQAMTRVSNPDAGAVLQPAPAFDPYSGR